MSIAVPDNVPPLSFTPVAVTVDNGSRAYVVGSSGGTGRVAIIDLTNNTVISTFNLISNDPQGVAYDPDDNELVIADTANDTVLFIELGDTTQQRAVDVTSPQSVAVDTSEDLAVVGSSDTTNSVVLIDLTTENVSAMGTITNADDPAAIYQGSLGVDTANGTAVFTSTFDDGSSQVTTKDITIPAFTNQQVFDDSSLRGIALTTATQAIAVDSDNDRASVVNINGVVGSATTVTVGSDPRGVTINTTDGEALVSNFEDHTVSIINLGSSSVTSTENVSLNPTSLAFSDSANATIVLGSGDDSVTILQ